MKLAQGLFLLGFLLVGMGLSQAAEWQAQDLAYRVALTAEAGPYRRTDAMVMVPVSAAKLVRSAKATGFLDVASLKLIEAGSNTATPCDYVDGNLIFRMTGQTAPLSKRTYRLHFNTVARKPASRDRRGAVLKESEVVPGVNLVANPSFEAPVKDARGNVLSDAEIVRIQGANLIPDADLEKGEWTIPEVKEPLKVALEKGPGRNDSTGLSIAATGATPNRDVSAVSPLFEVKPGAFYRFRLWQWLDKKPPTGRVSPLLRFYDDDKRLSSGAGRFIPVHSALKAKGEWRQMTYQGIAPQTARYAQAWVVCRGLSDTRAAFDDFEAYEVLSAPGWHPSFHYADPAMEMGLAFGDAPDGERAMRLSAGPLGARATAVYVSDRFPVKAGTTYVGGGEIKIVKPGPAVVISFKVYDKDGKVASKSHTAFMAGPHRAAVAGGWEPYKGGYTTPANAAWGQMVLSVGWGQGEAMFDKIYLHETPGGEAVKVTPGAVEKR